MRREAPKPERWAQGFHDSFAIATSIEDADAPGAALPLL